MSIYNKRQAKANCNAPNFKGMVIKRHTLTQYWEYFPTLTKLIKAYVNDNSFQMQNKHVKTNQCTLKYIKILIYRTKGNKYQIICER